VTEEMIREWIETYEEDCNNLQSPTFPKDEILTETGRKIENYTRNGVSFLKNFFRQSNK
jgi:hypothetical protein